MIHCTPSARARQDAAPKELVVTEELEPGTVVTNITAVDGDAGKFGEIHYIITGRLDWHRLWRIVYGSWMVHLWIIRDHYGSNGWLDHACSFVKNGSDTSNDLVAGVRALRLSR